MSVDAGMAQITDQLRALQGPSAEAGVQVSLEARLGRLATLLERRERRDQVLAQAVAPVDIPPLDFTVTAGVAKLKAHRAAPSEQSPQEGFIWFVQRLSLAGMNSGDVVNLYRTAAQVSAQNMNLIHTFTGPPASFLAPATVTTPAVPASTVAVQNVNTFPVQVVISGGTITAVVVNGITVGAAAGTYTVPASGAISITYSAAPTWAWSPAASVPSVAAGSGVADWEPGSMGLIMRPDDSFWIASAGTLVASEIILTGQAIQVAAQFLAEYLL